MTGPGAAPDERPDAECNGPYIAPAEELRAMQRVLYVLTDLDAAAQRRALIWLCSRLRGVPWDDLERVL